MTIGSDFFPAYSSAVQRTRCSFGMLDESICVELILTGDPAPRR